MCYKEIEKHQDFDMSTVISNVLRQSEKCNNFRRRFQNKPTGLRHNGVMARDIDLFDSNGLSVSARKCLKLKKKLGLDNSKYKLLATFLQDKTDMKMATLRQINKEKINVFRIRPIED